MQVSSEQVLQSQPVYQSAHSKARGVLILGAVLVAFPWLWPLNLGPMPQMLPNLVAWSCGALLLGLWWWLRDGFDKVLAAGVLLAATLNALIALLQYFDWESMFVPWIASSRPGEAFGNVQQRNLLASLLCMGLVSLDYLVRRDRMWHSLRWSLGAILILALAATSSRTGFMHIMLLTVLTVFWRRDEGRRIWLQAGALLLAYLLASVLMPMLLHWATGLRIDDLMARFLTDYQCASRRVIWSNMLELAALRPLTGWGAGELLFAHYITDYEGPRACIKLAHAHNLFLHWAVIWGWPLTALLTAAMILALTHCRPWAAKCSRGRFAWALLALMGAHSLVEFPMWYGWFQVVALCAGVLLVQSNMKRRTSDASGYTTSSRWRLPVLLTGSAALLTAFGLIAMDYFKASQPYLPLHMRPEYYRVDTLKRIQDTVLFQSHVIVAGVVSTPVTPSNAQVMLAAAQEALHTAPDSRIIRQLLIAASFLGRDDLVALHTRQYAAAWPNEYREWQAMNGLAPEK